MLTAAQRSVKETASLMIEALKRDGWAKYTRRDPNGKMCLLGVAEKVTTGNTGNTVYTSAVDDGIYEEFNNIVHAMCSKIRADDCASLIGAETVVVDWNNAKERTFEEVEQLLLSL